MSPREVSAPPNARSEWICLQAEISECSGPGESFDLQSKCAPHDLGSRHVCHFHELFDILHFIITDPRRNYYCFCVCVELASHGVSPDIPVFVRAFVVNTSSCLTVPPVVSRHISLLRHDPFPLCRKMFCLTLKAISIPSSIAWSGRRVRRMLHFRTRS